jgi:aminoglycoside/choline kinase family phosphotransferase
VNAFDDDRQGLNQWLAAAGYPDWEAVALPGDISPRRYERLRGAGGATVILARYPEELRAAGERFARTSEILAAAGVPVPPVLAIDEARGWMLVEDLGEATLAELRHLPWAELTPYFEDAADLATRIAAIPRELVANLNPPLDAPLMRRELAQTRRLFLEPNGLAPTPLAEGKGQPPATPIDQALEALCQALAADEPVTCHRDFMARNLVPRSPGRVAVLDHQDLRLGPPAYDLASLLNDTLFPPPEVERRLRDAAFPGEDGRLRYHRAAAQRTLKAVGTYAAFARRGSDRHLPLIGPTLRRFLRHFSRVPEGHLLVAGIEPAWLAAGDAPRLAPAS